MKVYKKENAIIVQNEGTLYYLEGQNWDEYINDDQLFQKLKASIGNAKTINFDQLDGLNPPIDSQELWASGVTYYMSKKGREEESKETGGSIFIPKFMKPTDRNCFLRRPKIGFRVPVKLYESEETLLGMFLSRNLPFLPHQMRK